MFCYIYAQKVVRSNMYAQVMGCPSMSVAQATDSAVLTAIVCGVMRVAALSLWCLAFSLQDFCQYII